MNIFLIGIQGCGKGTLVEGLKQHFDFNLISVGQLLREEVATGSDLGKKIDKLISAGNLVDIDTVMKTMSKKLKSLKHDITIFDGFPRNSEQAKEIDKILNVDMVFHLVLSKDRAIERLLNRLTCEKCGHITKKQLVDSDVCPVCGGKLITRTDDTIESIEKRFKIYEKETYPLLERYSSRVVEINADAEPDEVLAKAVRIIHDYN
ncbi:MAG: nucleoside monophosphate kinase [Clostridia bacterium]|nr:nucleoside monophosphate kinase [Clostridia bacterium]